MNILVHPNDIAAQKLVENLGGTIVSTDQQMHYYLRGGGRIPAVVTSVSSQELGNKAFSGQSEDGQIVVKINPLNPRLPKAHSEILGILKSETRDWTAPKPLKGRGGSVLYQDMANTGRLIEPTTPLPLQLPPNRYFGFYEPVVKYGTSDAANVFELLQVLKASAYLGMPAVFDQYQSAHTVGDFCFRVANPSWQLLGIPDLAGSLGLDPRGKFSQPIDRSLLKQFLVQLRPAISHNLYNAAYSADFAGWYRQGMQLLCWEIARLLDIKASLAVMPSEDFFRQMPQWQWTPRQLAQQVHAQAKTSVNLFNSPQGQVKTTDDLPHDVTVADLHQQGWWLGGAAVYHLSYALGQEGGLVCLVKDGAKGQVHHQAWPVLENPHSGLHLLPVNLIRLHAQGQDCNASIDPWVFLEIIKRWGRTRSQQHLRQIWDLIEVPLSRDNIGKETRIAISLDGLEVQVT